MAIIDKLWAEMRDSLGDRIVPVRDAVWWHFRYQQHPQFSYRTFLLKDRLTRRPLGCLALKPGRDGLWELMDWVAPRERAPAMVDAARTVVAQAGGATVLGWFSSSVLDAVRPTGPEVVDIGVGVPTNILTPGPAVADLTDRWWLAGGDTDFR
jgi:hypothetical protein